MRPVGFPGSQRRIPDAYAAGIGKTGSPTDPWRSGAHRKICSGKTACAPRPGVGENPELSQ